MKWMTLMKLWKIFKLHKKPNNVESWDSLINDLFISVDKDGGSFLEIRKTPIGYKFWVAKDSDVLPNLPKKAA